MGLGYLWSLDFAGSLGVTPRGAKYVLEHFSKWTRGVDSLGGVVYHVQLKFATPILHVINNFKNYEFFSTYT